MKKIIAKSKPHYPSSPPTLSPPVIIKTAMQWRKLLEDRTQCEARVEELKVKPKNESTMAAVKRGRDLGEARLKLESVQKEIERCSQVVHSAFNAFGAASYLMCVLPQDSLWYEAASQQTPRTVEEGLHKMYKELVIDAALIQKVLAEKNVDWIKAFLAREPQAVVDQFAAHEAFARKIPVNSFTDLEALALKIRRALVKAGAVNGAPLKDYTLSGDDAAETVVAHLNKVEVAVAQTLIDGMVDVCGDDGDQKVRLIQVLAKVTQGGVWQHIAAKLIAFMQATSTTGAHKAALAQDNNVQTLLKDYTLSSDDAAENVVELLNGLDPAVAQTLIDGMVGACGEDAQKANLFLVLAQVTQVGVWEHIADKLIAFVQDETNADAKVSLAQNREVQKLLKDYALSSDDAAENVVELLNGLDPAVAQALIDGMVYACRDNNEQGAIRTVLEIYIENKSPLELAQMYGYNRVVDRLIRLFLCEVVQDLPSRDRLRIMHILQGFPDVLSLLNELGDDRAIGFVKEATQHHVGPRGRDHIRKQNHGTGYSRTIELREDRRLKTELQQHLLEDDDTADDAADDYGTYDAADVADDDTVDDAADDYGTYDAASSDSDIDDD
ncbi:MAG: hypothetical protein AB7F28_03410 [Candidatus Margulisiibacteriota bacterium]